jgi:hypothetical protein
MNAEVHRGAEDLRREEFDLHLLQPSEVHAMMLRGPSVRRHRTVHECMLRGEEQVFVHGREYVFSTIVLRANRVCHAETVVSQHEHT